MGGRKNCKEERKKKKSRQWEKQEIKTERRQETYKQEWEIIVFSLP